MKRTCILLLLCAALAGFTMAQNGAAQHWVATWTTADLQAPVLRLPSVGQTVTPAQQALLGFNNQTIRMVVPVTLGGRRLKVHFSNVYSSTPLTIGAAHVAIHGKDSAIVAGSDHALKFGGKAGITVPAGAAALSDAIDMEVPQLGELAVSLYIPNATGTPTVHPTALQNTYISKQGDTTADAEIADAAISQSWYFVSAVDVLAPQQASAILAFGDSITDGARSSVGTRSSWPSQFARRISTNGNVAVLNQGIGGNRLMHDGTGPNALARFDQDVLAQAGVRWLVILEGINDIGRATGPTAVSADAVTAEELIAAQKQMIERAHSRGIRVVGATLTPYRGAAYFSEKGEVMREALNDWIRTGGAYDAVVDFDAATRDSKNTQMFKAEYDSGDHLHPGDAGYKAMADAVDPAIFRDKAVTASAK